MQMVKKILLWFCIVWFALLLFMPKTELYYTLERELSKQNIRLNEGSIEEGLLHLTVRDVTVYVEGIALAKIESIHFFTLLGYSTLEMKQVVLDALLKNKVPSPLEKVSFSYTVFSPLSVNVDINDSYGLEQGTLSLSTQTLRIHTIEEKLLKMVKPYLKEDEEGWYYEISF